jgi:hypothetical protein
VNRSSQASVPSTPRKVSHIVKGFGRVVAVLALAASSASANTIYSVRAEWLAAVNSTYTADFEDIATGASPVTYHTLTGYTDGPINVIGYGEGNWFLRNQHGVAASPYNWGTGAVLESANNMGNTRLHITVTGSPTAFGMNMMTIGYGNPVGISINGDPEITVPTSLIRSSPTFWGITYDGVISTIDVRPLTMSTALLIDNVSTALGIPENPGTETPEASTVLLTASGLLLVGVSRLRGRR